jgi:hypothetical protein
MTGAIPYHVVALHHAADLGLSGNVNLGGEVELQSGLGGFIITTTAPLKSPVSLPGRYRA